MPEIKDAIDCMSTAERVQTMEYLWSVLSSYYDCLMSDIDALAYYGGVHRQYHGFYKALSSRFPYAIYYKLSEGFVKVYAVLDTRRKPARNDARLDESDDE